MTTFERLRKFAVTKVSHTQLSKQIEARHQKCLKTACYRRWIKVFQQVQAERPDKEFLSKFYTQILKRRAVKILYNYRSYRMVQNSMNANAQVFYTRSIQKKAFNELVNYFYQRNLKSCRNEVAIQNYKRLVMNRWYLAKQKVVEIRNQILNPRSNFEFTSSYKNLNSNLRKSLQVIQSEEQEQLCIEDLASTQDLVKAHDRLSSKIQ